MKKTYIKPSTETVQIEMEQVIASSGGELSFGSDGNSGVGSLNDDYADEVLSKGRDAFSFYDL